MLSAIFTYVSPLLTGCPLNKFQCDDGPCIDSNKACNGVADCKDSSDESPTMCGKYKL